MGKRLALLTIRLLMSVNLLCAAIFLKFAAVPGSVALFTQMSGRGPRVGISASIPAGGQEPSRRWLRFCS